MKNKRKISVLAALVSAIMLTGSFAPSYNPVSANSANREYFGYDSSGVIVATDDCPIVVDKENLTFNVGKNDGSTGYTDYVPITYKGNVTAEYTFRNPSELTASVRCMFPFGFLPSGEADITPGSGNFAVGKNGEKADTKIRLSYKPYSYETFDAETDWKSLSDDYDSDGFFKPETPVYEYEITVGKGGGKNLPEIVRFSYREKESVETVVLFDYLRYDNDDGVIKLDRKVGEDAEMTVTFINRDVPIAESNFEFLDSKQKSTDGSVTITKKPVSKLIDYSLGFRPSGLGASDVDWYNATVAMLEYRSNVMRKDDFRLENTLFCWYDYTLTFAPGETLVNTVVAPLFPTVNGWYEPPKYEYTYLLSPAATWAGFKDLTVRINTDMFLLDGVTEKRTLDEYGNVRLDERETVEFEKKDGFYVTHFDELPDGELIFNLCSVESPERYRSSYGCIGGCMRMFFGYIGGCMRMFF